MHAAVQFSLSYTVTVNAESVDGPRPAARVTWNTSAPPQCVASVMVDFRTSSKGPVITSNTTNTSSQTEIIQSDLQCGTYYYITVNVTGKKLNGILPTVSSRPMQVLVGSKRLYA